MSSVECTDGSEGQPASALVSVRIVTHREEAVSGLLAHVRAGVTAGTIAMLGGLWRSLGLLEDGEPLSRPY